jgi:DNA-binding transcriptional MerR regulator
MPKLPVTPPSKLTNPLKIGAVIPRRYPRKTIMYQGVAMRLYSLAWLSHLCVKSQRTFHLWERKGFFPTPVFDLKNGYRWYCAAEIHGYRRIVQSSGLRSGRYADGKKRTDWLRTTSFAFKSKLEELIKQRLGEVPVKLADEDEILLALSRRERFKMTEKEMLRLIQP